MKLWIAVIAVVICALSAVYIAYTLDNGPNYKIDVEAKVTFDPEDPPLTPGAT